MYKVDISRAKRKTLLPTLEEMIMSDNMVCSDALPDYNTLDISSIPISAIIIPPVLSKGRTISMGLKTFGIKRRAA